MVTKASNYGAREAPAIGLVEVIAPSVPALLDEIDGMKTVPKGIVLETSNAQIEDVEMSFWQRARDFLVDPNLITLMLSIGLIGSLSSCGNPAQCSRAQSARSFDRRAYGLEVLLSLAGSCDDPRRCVLHRRGFVPTHGALSRRRGHIRGRRAILSTPPATRTRLMPVAIGIARALARLLGFAMTRGAPRGASAGGRGRARHGRKRGGCTARRAGAGERGALARAQRRR